jgi:hypothetical protein
MGPEQVKPGRGDEHAELLDELQRVEQQVGGAVAARVRQLIEQLSPGALRQAVGGQGRAQQVAAEVLELLAGVRGQGDVGVERDPSRRAQRSLASSTTAAAVRSRRTGWPAREPVAIASWMEAAA